MFTPKRGWIAPTTGIPDLWLELDIHTNGTTWDGPAESIWVKIASAHSFLAITSLVGEIQWKSKRGMKVNSMMTFLRRWE